MLNVSIHSATREICPTRASPNLNSARKKRNRNSASLYSCDIRNNVLQELSLFIFYFNEKEQWVLTKT